MIAEIVIKFFSFCIVFGCYVIRKFTTEFSYKVKISCKSFVF